MAYAVSGREIDRREEMFNLECVLKGEMRNLPCKKKNSPHLVLKPVLSFLPLKYFPQELTIGKTDAALNIQASYLSNCFQ